MGKTRGFSLVAAAAILTAVTATSEAAANRCDLVAGAWNWPRGRQATFSLGGAASARGEGITYRGTWRCLDPKSGRVQIKWLGGLFTTWVTPTGASSLKGDNVIGEHFTASRIGAAPKVAAEEVKEAARVQRPTTQRPGSETEQAGRAGRTAPERQTETQRAQTSRAAAKAAPDTAKKPEPAVGPVAENPPRPAASATAAARPGSPPADDVVFSEGEKLSRINPHPPLVTWTSDDKRRVGGAFSTISELAPELMRRVTAYGPLKVYRSGGIGAGAGVGSQAMAFADYGRSVLIFDAFLRRFPESARRRDHYHFVDGPDIPLAVLYLIHELVHYVDAGGAIVDSKEWRDLIGPVIKQVNDQLLNLHGETCYQLEFASRFESESRELQEANMHRRAITRSAGMPSPYSCVHPAEALPEYVTLYIYSPAFRASVAPSIARFIQRRFLDPAAGPDPSIAAFLNGIQHREGDNCGAANEAFSGAIRINPAFARALLERGQCWQHEKVYDRAIEDFDEVLRLQANNAMAYARRGNAFESKGEYGRAIADFEAAIRLFAQPEQATAGTYAARNGVAVTLRDRGRTYIRTKQYDRAIADFNEALRQPAFEKPAHGARDPVTATIFLLRGYAYSLTDQFDRALPDLNEAIALDPENASAYTKRGNVHLLRKDYDRALSDYTSAIERDPQDREAYSFRGMVYVNKEDHNRAIADLNQAIVLDGKDSFTYLQRGLAYAGKGELDTAIVDLSKAIELDPKNAQGYRNRGRVYGNKKQYDQAIADFDEVIRIDPKNAESYLDRGRAYAFKQQHDKAIADFNDAIRLGPRSADSYFARGSAYYETKNLPAAIADFTELLRLNPSDFRGYANRARAYHDQRDFDRAIADYTQTIKMRPNVTVAHLFRGMVYSDKGDFRSAIADFSEAIRLNPRQTAAIRGRASNYQKIGETQKAIADYERLLELSAGDKDATEALKRLRGG
ncbi:tetratricopeptide repeat protein [Bradyrhizobium sediminis]|uniref:Tetratricopeptide repeat protein n=1 Tax=Bradyrhizobium sediminis TaxID=2840469 RepID=A0A975NUL6_9BRAD|nr:tetratricopeptide repeat protein [Bradyrhizobium sediminis]QWG21275.1 tetratricopeptide repeat protein [Bradyrhizobium sediminis]